jgi:ParB/RepB/Spo0J family partition protein
LSSIATVSVAEVHVPDNVRRLDAEHVTALAASIALQGMLVPIVVRPVSGEEGRDGRQYELVAGFHRIAAAAELGLAEVPAVIRAGDQEASDRAVENIARKQLDPQEEAVAVKAMLVRGLSEDGAAQALGWPKARVTARMKLLELPERAQQLTGAGAIPLSAVDDLRAIGRTAPRVLDLLVEYLASDDDGWAADRLASDPGWVLGQALRERGAGVFAADLTTLSRDEIAELNLGKKAGVQLAEAEQLHRQLDRYAYGPPTVRFTERDVDEARAAGVLIELGGAQPIIVDRPLYRQLAKRAIERTVTERREKTAAAAQQRKRDAKREANRPADPAAEARREHNRRLRQLAEQAHGANLDLWASLANGLAVVDPAASMDVARFFTYSLLGPDHASSPYTQTGERVAHLAACGIRLVIGELRTNVTKTRKDGSRGALRIDYGSHNNPAEAIKWLWKFIDGARTPGELFGRALVVVCAEQYANRLVVPQSQRGFRLRWGSHKDIATKALAKLSGPHLPASLKQLEKAIERAEREQREAEQQEDIAPEYDGAVDASAPEESGGDLEQAA